MKDTPLLKLSPWIEEQLQALLSASSQEELFQHLVKTAEILGFDYCAFGLCLPYPLTAPKTLVMSNYPKSWQQRYHDHHYVELDPIAQHDLHSTLPLVWSAEQSNSPFWQEASAAGISQGWSQSYCNSQKVPGMLTLSRSSEPISGKELAEKAPIFAWLTQLSYAGFYPFMTSKLSNKFEVKLTEREKEVLRWTADGKTASQIAEIMSVSERTIHFHTNHILEKLGAANKVAATVQAVIFGLI